LEPPPVVGAVVLSDLFVRVEHELLSLWDDDEIRSRERTHEAFEQVDDLPLIADALRASVPAEVQSELFRLFTSDPEASFQRMVEIAAEKGVTLTVDEVVGFLKQMDEDDEFDDVELDAVALAAIAGGGGGTWGRGRGC
jgi:hypothetical protein